MHPPQEKSGDVTLRQGRHAIELGFVQGGGGYELAVLWQPPSGKAAPRAARMLSLTPPPPSSPKG